MTDKQTTPFARALDDVLGQLHNRNALRVWSVVITIFGDSVYPRGGVVSAATLTAITERLHISAGTLRVSLSRLAKEKWIEREKQGRNSFYKLTKEGSPAFGSAAQHIYAASPPADDTRYSFVQVPPLVAAKRRKLDQVVLDHGGMEIIQGLYLLPGTASTQLKQRLDTGLFLNGSKDQMPEWVREAILPDHLAREFDTLNATLEKLNSALAGPQKAINPLDAIAARTLVIHLWRRLILQQANIPVGLLPGDWPGETTRDLVMKLYRKLEDPSEAWLAGEFGGTASSPSGRFIKSE